MIINLTQHSVSPEQIDAGVIDFGSKNEIKKLLTFNVPPNVEEMTVRAQKLAQIALNSNSDAAMVGGAPYFIKFIETSLRKIGVTPLHAFTRREVEEKDGRKISVFRHIGWVTT